jgi:uncharacterized protein
MTGSSMTIDWDVPITMDDGTVLRADVFRPAAPGRYPVILSHGVYGKGLPLTRFQARLFSLLNKVSATGRGAVTYDQVQSADLADTVNPDATVDVADGDYRAWEVVDPGVWVPAGYACVRVDARGSGSSPGYLDPMSPREIDDFAACIEWAGTRDWSSGKVGLCGKSYYAMTQWLVAARRPPHLAAICVWHGLSDWYRDATRHGGIMSQYREKFWLPRLVLPVQYGADAGTNPHSGRPVAGDEKLGPAALAARRADVVADIRRHPLDDDYYRQRTPELSQITVPVLAAADWSDHDLHLRGTIRGFQKAASRDSWLEVHAGGQFDDPGSVELQQRFFDYYLKGGSGDWPSQPRVQLAVRQADGSSVRRDAADWPLPGTAWQEYYLDPAVGTLNPGPLTADSAVSYDTDGDGAVLLGPLSTAETTLLGPVSALLYVSSSTTDADLFLTLDAVDAQGTPVELRDHRWGLTPVTVGWQRASLRAVDPAASAPGQPYHPFTQAQPLAPGQAVPVEVELCPTSLQLPPGYRLRLTVRGNGTAHNDPADRPASVFAGTVTLHAGPAAPSRLLVPVVR